MHPRALHYPPALLSFLALAACGDTTAPESSDGILVVAVATTGADRDPDGYLLALDRAMGREVATTGRTALAPVPAGRHTLVLSGLAANCRVEGANPRPVTVVARDTAEVALSVACTAVSGATRIVTITSGISPDPDGYVATVDHRAPQTIAPSGSLIIVGLAPGEHTIGLTGVASECTLLGDNPAVVPLQAGQAVEVTFRVTCGAPAGELLFNASVGDVSHVFHRRPDGSTEDLTPGAEASDGRWSPDGARIAFDSDRSGTTGIYLMDADGGHVTQLTNNGEIAPDWSPDGTRILFWPYVTRGFGSISVMHADGTEVEVLGQGSLPVWSPDGTRIAFERQNGVCVFDLCGIDIYTMAADGSDVRRLTSTTTPFEYAAVPAWSPDGTRIAYLSGDYTRAPSLRIMTTDGINVANLGTVGSRAVWSPDGQAIAATTAAPGPDAPILVFPLSGGQPYELVHRPGVSIPTDWR